MRAMALLAVIVVMLSGVPISAVNTGTVPLSKVPLGAAAAILMDVASGEIMHSRNIHAKLPPASLTKIMTALLAAESGKLDAVVTVSPRAVEVEPRNIWLSPGENITLQHLIYGLLLRSGNDAALAIAYFLAGGVEAFAAMMNERAKELGAVNTHFTNPHGLPDVTHFSTAHDLALMARALLHVSFLRRVVATTRYRAPWENRPYQRIWHNTNRLLQLMPGADGIKTGWTRAAGRCLASSATRQGWQLLAIVLDSSDHYGESRALLEWGFTYYRRVVIIERGLYMGAVRVRGGEPAALGAVTAEELSWVAPRGHSLQVSTAVHLPHDLRPPIAAGSVIGELSVAVGTREVGSVPLIADQAAYPTSWLRRKLHRANLYLRFLHRALLTLP